MLIHSSRPLFCAIAEFRGVSMENVFTGVGSDEAIDLLMRIVCVPGKDRCATTSLCAPPASAAPIALPPSLLLPHVRTSKSFGRIGPLGL